MSDEKNEPTINEVVKAMGDEVKPDVPKGLMVIPKGASASALARRTAGEISRDEAEFHCMSCGWSKSLKFDPEEIEALGGNIGDYTGPCPSCKCMTLTLKDAFWGKDFPTMTALAEKNKRAEARIQAEELVGAVKEAVSDMVPGVPKPETAAAPTGREDLPAEPDLTDLKPR